MQSLNERHEFHTPYGNIQCKNLSWNSQWNPEKGQIQKLCEFGPFHVASNDGWDTEVFEQCSYYAGRGNHELFVPSHEKELVDNEVQESRQRVANFIKCLALYPRAEQIYELFNSILSTDFTFYLHHSNLKKSFPLIENICLQQVVGGHVYVLSDQQGHYKIGKAVKIDRRIAQLKTQPPFKLQLVMSTWDVSPLKLERYLHDEFSTRRLNGEWFALTEGDLAFLEGYFEANNRSGSLLRELYEKSRQAAIDRKPIPSFTGSLWDYSIGVSAIRSETETSQESSNG